MIARLISPPEPRKNITNVAERVRLLRLLTSRPSSESASAYDAQPTGPEEFSADYDPLSWDADGWEAVG